MRRPISTFLFYALLPLVGFALPVLVFSTAGLLFGALLYLLIPPFGLVLLAICVAAVAGLIGEAWLWIALVRSSERVSKRELEMARTGVLVGCGVALYYVARSWMQLSSPGERADISFDVTVLQAIAVFLLAGLGLVAWWWTPRRAGSSVSVAHALPVVIAIWATFGLTTFYSHQPLQAYIKTQREGGPKPVLVKSDDPVARSICAGDLEHAAKMLAAPKAKPDASLIVHACLTRTTPGGGAIVLPERLALAVRAVLLAEERAGLDAPKGCTPLRQRLLSLLVVHDIGLLVPLREKGWPLDCSLASDGRPVWWSLFTSDGRRQDSLADLQLLDHLGVAWRQTNEANETLFSVLNAKSLRSLSDESLLFLLDRTEPSKASMSKLSVDVVRRRFLLAKPDSQPPLVGSLASRVGEPDITALTPVRMSELLLDSEIDQGQMRAYLLARLDSGRRADSSPEGTERAGDALLELAKQFPR